MLWVKQYCCPLMEKSLKFTDVSRKEMNNEWRNDFHIGEKDSGIHIVNKNMSCKILEDSHRCDPYLSVFANIQDTPNIVCIHFSVNENLYLIPYLFKKIECRYNYSERVRMLSQLLPDRLKKLQKLGFFRNISACTKYLSPGFALRPDGVVMTPFKLEVT